jgi:diadenosine tetraphosphatase ApaH/serine/threonine PP2A family protein phosphatase
MKLALLSDIHSNRQALDACMAHARAQGAQRFAWLGDLVGYGADPGYVVQQAMALVADGHCVIGGNHDALAVHPPQPGDRVASTVAAQGASWTHGQLTPHERAFLASRPLIAEVGGVLLVHASADAPERWRYVDNEAVAEQCLDAATQRPGIRHVFCGHVHQQTLYYRGTGRGLMRFAPQPGVAIPVAPRRQWVATIGSVGQPRDGDPRAMYALLDTDAWLLRFERVPYDHAAAATAIRATGAMPDYFAQRLEVGR